MYTWRKPDPLTMEMQALASLECKSQSPRVSSGEECARAYVNFGKWTNTSLGSRERKKNGGASESIMLLFLLYAICKAPFDNWSFSSWKSSGKIFKFCTLSKKYRFSFFELNFNVTNHSENQASSPTSSTQRINVIRHTFWLSSLVKGWPQKNRPAGQPNKKTVFQLFFTPLATVYLHVVGHIPCLIDVQIKLSLCTELMNRAWKIFVCKKPALEGASETLIMALFSWKSLYSFFALYSSILEGKLQMILSVLCAKFLLFGEKQDKKKFWPFGEIVLLPWKHFCGFMNRLAILVFLLQQSRLILSIFFGSWWENEISRYNFSLIPWHYLRWSIRAWCNKPFLL